MRFDISGGVSLIRRISDTVVGSTIKPSSAGLSLPFVGAKPSSQGAADNIGGWKLVVPLAGHSETPGDGVMDWPRSKLSRIYAHTQPDNPPASIVAKQADDERNDEELVPLRPRHGRFTRSFLTYRNNPSHFLARWLYRLLYLVAESTLEFRRLQRLSVIWKDRVLVESSNSRVKAISDKQILLFFCERFRRH